VSVIVKGKNPRKPHTVRFWVDGKQRERSFATAKEARDFKTKTDYDTRANIFVDDRLGREKFQVAAETWIERKAITGTTKAAYRSILSVHIGPSLGDRTLVSVANDRDAVADLLVVKMTGMSYTLRKTARLIITGVLDEAVTAGKLQSHRCAGIEIVSGARNSDRKDFIFPDHAQLVMLAAGLPYPLTIWLMRGCGLRIQEAMAVQKSCFRDGGKTLRVFEQAGRKRIGTAPLKHRVEGEFRDVPVPGYVWAIVKDLPDGYLFRDGDGGRFPSYNTYLKAFTREAEAAQIPEGFTPHSLRHAFVSALLARNVPITDVAQWLGHRDINETYRTYGHLVPSAAARAVSVLDAEYSEWAAIS
jgi:integrase